MQCLVDKLTTKRKKSYLLSRFQDSTSMRQRSDENGNIVGSLVVGYLSVSKTFWSMTEGYKVSSEQQRSDLCCVWMWKGKVFMQRTRINKFSHSFSHCSFSLLHPSLTCQSSPTQIIIHITWAERRLDTFYVSSCLIFFPNNIIVVFSLGVALSYILNMKKLSN